MFLIRQRRSSKRRNRQSRSNSLTSGWTSPARYKAPFLIFGIQLAVRCTGLLELWDINRSGGRLRPPFRNLLQATYPLQFYVDLYLTEQPYGLVCGVETDLPAND